jgi:LmbE family N-acetylglucosaminyl deacetylase
MSYIYPQPHSFLGEKVLVFAPHPDDETFGCGGSIKLHTAHGDELKVVVLTDGSAGDFLNREPNRAQYVLKREEETYRAAEILGIRDLEFWGYADAHLREEDRSFHRMKQLIRNFMPSVIYIPARTEMHIDHLAAFTQAWNAAKDARWVKKLLFYEVHTPTLPNGFVDISSVLSFKSQACQQYVSQLEVFDYQSAIVGLNAFRAMKFAPQVKYVEAFQLLEQPFSLEKLNG